MSWWDSLAYANAFSEAEGLAPCYVLSGCEGEAGHDLVCASVSIDAADGIPYSCRASVGTITDVMPFDSKNWPSLSTILLRRPGPRAS